VSTPSNDFTNATVLADSFWSPDQQPGRGGKGKGRSNTPEDSEEDNSETDNASNSDDSDEEEPTEEGLQRGGSLEPYADWDNGEILTPEERAQIMKLSLYKRSRKMNIRRRKRMEADLARNFRTLTDDTRETQPKPSTSQKPKAQHTASGPTDGPPHCSLRKVAK
jgi:hypothetical protein